MKEDEKFETENKNEHIANESVLNSNVKESITNRDLVELGFPEFILARRTQDEYSASRFTNEEVDFYNALYTLVKLYEKYTSKKLELRAVEHVEFLHGIYAVYLNKIKVLDGRVLGGVYRDTVIKYQSLDEIKKMVEELLVYFDNDFDALKREFVKQYAEEKAKIDFNAIEIYNEDVAERLRFRKHLKYIEKRDKIEELLETEEFREKEVYRLNEPLFFGESYSLKPLGEKLKNSNYFKNRLTGVYLFRNILVLDRLQVECAIILDENEKEEILKLHSLFEDEIKQIKQWGE